MSVYDWPLAPCPQCGRQSRLAGVGCPPCMTCTLEEADARAHIIPKETPCSTPYAPSSVAPEASAPAADRQSRAGGTPGATSAWSTPHILCRCCQYRWIEDTMDNLGSKQ